VLVALRGVYVVCCIVDTVQVMLQDLVLDGEIRLGRRTLVPLMSTKWNEFESEPWVLLGEDVKTQGTSTRTRGIVKRKNKSYNVG
jgi:hypothetical protein